MKPERDNLALFLSYTLLVVTFGGSYLHVAGAVEAWGQKGWMAYLIAAMPEVTVFLGMRKVMKGSATRVTWFILASGGAFTLAGNLNSAQHTVMGVIAAAWPAWSAISALILSGVHSTDPHDTAPETLIPVTQTPLPVTPETWVGRPLTPVTLPDPEPIVTPVTPVPAARVKTPVARSSAKVVDPEADPVTLWLRTNWDSSSPLTREVKEECAKVNGVSVETVKRRARELVSA
jgi:hypothetical protein